jgi:hypothetical protein
MSDTAKRVEDQEYPHVEGVMSDLVQGINDPDQCRFVLDIPLTQCSMPEPLGFVRILFYST